MGVMHGVNVSVTLEGCKVEKIEQRITSMMPETENEFKTFQQYGFLLF